MRSDSVRLDAVVHCKEEREGRVSKKPEPQGTLKHHHSEVRQTIHAVYVDTYFEDENGDLWYYHSSSFRFALKPKGDK